MAWITSSEVEPILQTDLSTDSYIDALIDHLQQLAEVVTGDIADGDATPELKAVFAEIVARRWRGGKAASTNPAGHQSESVEDYSYSDPTGAHLSQNAGLGLTKHEKRNLRSAIGRTGIWRQPTTRGPVETAPRNDDDLGDWLEGSLGHTE